nr:CAZy families GT14 protein [uncultured Clostridium sp.]
MRIGFIMLCHKNPEQINRLIAKLSEFSEADVYIHVDLNHLEIKNQIIKQKNVYLVSEECSYHIQWGSVDIVKATLQLIREVRDSGVKYDYVWLLSGQDYPICSITRN